MYPVSTQIFWILQEKLYVHSELFMQFQQYKKFNYINIYYIF